MQVIFAHVSGGTYRMRVSRQRMSPSTSATVRKPVAVVSDATRDHERDMGELQMGMAVAMQHGAPYARYLGHESPMLYSWRDLVFYNVHGI